MILASEIGCNSTHNTKISNMSNKVNNNYSQDKEFLKKYGDVIELSSGDKRVLLSSRFQGRVFTSSANGENGLSFGWINYSHFESGAVSTQFNPYGGEERIWFGPEGGPYSIYFQKDKEQTFENWKVPVEIDTITYSVVEKSPEHVKFSKDFQFTNYSGHQLKVGLERSVKLINAEDAERTLGCPIDKSLSYVGYQSDNALINRGINKWNENTGVLSIWMLSMFNPSPVGVVFIPFKDGEDLGKIVTDDYFGKVPSERLIIRNNIIFFNIDGKLRSKIGISPERALPYCGSYDSQNKVLTILWFTLPDKNMQYVNAIWGKQENPLKGDAVNSYNDGPVEDGSVMGPFYEIESSSPAAFLAPEERMEHVQRIYHFVGDEQKLDIITKRIFNLSIEEIKSVFK